LFWFLSFGILYYVFLESINNKSLDNKDSNNSNNTNNNFHPISILLLGVISPIALFVTSNFVSQIVLISKKLTTKQYSSIKEFEEHEVYEQAIISNSSSNDVGITNNSVDLLTQNNLINNEHPNSSESTINDLNYDHNDINNIDSENKLNRKKTNLINEVNNIDQTYNKYKTISFVQKFLNIWNFIIQPVRDSYL